MDIVSVLISIKLFTKKLRKISAYFATSVHRWSLNHRIGSTAMATGSFLLGTAGVHQIIMKLSQQHSKMHQN